MCDPKTDPYQARTRNTTRHTSSARRTLWSRLTMNILVICSLLFAWGEAASLNADKRANGDVGCLYNGVFEFLGSKFGSLDGCNTCVCTVTGIQCTATACSGAVTARPVTGPVSVPGTAGTCVNPATSQLYQNGQTYPSSDACNTCTCTNGNIVCTHNTCTGQGIAGTCVNPATSQLYQNGQTYPSSDACNTCTCTNGNIVCTHNTCTGLNIGVNLHPGGNSHTGSTCYDNSQHLFHNDGDSYTSLDGCNTCTCSTGILSCTNNLCNTGVVGACYDIGTNKYYSNGQIVRASDGCNTCTCSSNKFTCTRLVCSPIG
ncbi:kielin/chordin-like protein isoform X7 [Haliotis rufescens]|uniref:kielin/chordin-like protein isoform X7 n=1 Tax=Haliotis rufescens TaxID=6454 RepID=UPI00201EADFA|nr:kielin/chordin-like protein isoform X7 [Haliotis rufescens]